MKNALGFIVSPNVGPQSRGWGNGRRYWAARSTQAGSLRYISGKTGFMSTIESLSRGTDFNNRSAGNTKRKSVGERHREINTTAVWLAWRRRELADAFPARATLAPVTCFGGKLTTSPGEPGAGAPGTDGNSGPGVAPATGPARSARGV
jgi:hypothetical protein